MRFESSAEISASSEAIWEALARPEEWPEWIASVKRIEKLSVDALGIGSRLRIAARAGIFDVRLLMTITEFVPRQRVVMQGRVLGTRLTRYYALEGGDQKTRVSAGGEVSGLLACLVARGGQRLSDEIVQSFKKKMEGRQTTFEE
jgi:carbon monoxide dehydrogenase subunit G